MASHDSDILSHLHVSLQQASHSPPAVTITVTNTARHPVTLLTWNSPLDAMALSLGLLTLTVAGAPAPLAVPTIKVARKMPPAAAAIVGLAPGESRENRVELGAPRVPLDRLRGAKVDVRLKGRWMQVWPRAREAVTRDMIERLGAEGDAVSGDFEAEGIVLEI